MLDLLLGKLQRFLAVAHVRDQPVVNVALVCVPTHIVSGMAWELLQARTPLVECASLEAVLSRRITPKSMM